ncbi:MAG: carbohydrate-binding domain-containing protein [Clostridia bacterium]|nr:carbohydrate-binding domain-containing protein [Clostridia bacterium]
MKLNRLILSILLLSAILLTGCGKNDTPDLSDGTTATPPAGEQLGDESQGFGEAIADLGAYNGYFEGESTDVEVTCLSGTKTCFKLVGNTLIFSGITADTVCTVSGKLRGSIVIDIGDDYRFDLELHGLSLVGEGTAPITVMGGDKVTVTAKKGYENYIYDTRDAIGEESTTQKAGAIHSEVDLEIAGKGALTVVSEKNNGIHSKKDLKVKNLTLLVACADNALKGNDSVELTSCATTLIATDGDGIKTSNSDISSKGNQRGTVLIVGGSHKIYAACDGIDAAYNVEIDDSSTSLEIYTDKYSNYSNEVTAVQEDVRYIRFTEKVYTYSV